MNLSMLQTELVACALCAADGKDPDETLPTESMETLKRGHDALSERVVTRKAWHCYEQEARRLVLAAETLAKFSQNLTLFGTLAKVGERTGHA